MPIINSRIRFIERFLENFHSAFSTKHQRSMFREFIYAMFSDYKRMSLPQSQDKFHSKSPTFFHSDYALPPPSFLRFLAL